PKDGVTIQDSPAEIGIEFGGMMRITQFEVTGPDGSVPLDGQPGSEQVERYFVKPGEILSAGDYQVRWRGLSDDGHMMTDGFNFSVEP
ncbi:copper resistance CopC family protein, partial [Halomonas sp. MES3-P3E]